MSKFNVRPWICDGVGCIVLICERLREIVGAIDEGRVADGVGCADLAPKDEFRGTLPAL
jgi:hypothetical protein